MKTDVEDTLLSRYHRHEAEFMSFLCKKMSRAPSFSAIASELPALSIYVYIYIHLSLSLSLAAGVVTIIAVKMRLIVAYPTSVANQH